MTEVAERADVAQGVARLIYPLTLVSPGERPHPEVEVADRLATTEDVSAMFEQMTKLFTVSAYIWADLHTGRRRSRGAEELAIPRVGRMRAESPLEVVLSLPPAFHTVGAIGALIIVAERVCTFGPRVRAKRRQWQLEAERFRGELQRLSSPEQNEYDLEIGRVIGVSEFRPAILDLADDEDELDEFDEEGLDEFEHIDEEDADA